ncbi:MAG TPA: carboxymuconolactone decarboxylase family protein [Polyangiaceae bacterium]|jgi:alkylhydroperoxidase family enzyme|nr:carboxymuconolactone decarboxylase family protein [Polyangiaceae bacterium]
MVRLDKPRIPPLEESQFTDDLRAILPPRGAGQRQLNVFTTIAQYPKLLKRWLVFAGHVLGKSSLGARDRELLILRTGWRCRAEYEWGQHAVIGRMVGLSDDEIRRITEGPDAVGWSTFDATLLRAADELHDDQMLGDETWEALSARYDTHQMMDVVFTVGQYTLVSMALNAFGVQLDAGIEGFPQ